MGRLLCMARTIRHNSKKELIKQIQSEANKKENKPISEETRRRMSVAFTGRTHTEESNEKNRQKAIQRHKDGLYDYSKAGQHRIGKQQTQYQKDRAREANECAWLVTDPQGNQMNIVNLRKFCIENGLNQGNLSRGKHKGWKATKIDLINTKCSK